LVVGGISAAVSVSAADRRASERLSSREAVVEIRPEYTDQQVDIARGIVEDKDAFF
jgi:hypothetical protein